MEQPSTNGVILELPSTNGEMNILELPSTNGEKILQALHDIKQDMKIVLEIERAATKKSFEEQIGDLAGFKEEIKDRVMAEVVDLLPTPAAVVDILPAPLDDSGWTIIDGVWRKEQRAKEAQVLPSDEQLVPTEENQGQDPHYDIDNIGNILQGSQLLRIYCFPGPNRIKPEN